MSIARGAIPHAVGMPPRKPLSATHPRAGGVATLVAGPRHGVFSRAAGRLRRAVPYDAAGWFAMDPRTILPTNPTLIENGIPDQCTTYWEREFMGQDALPFRTLARSSRPAGTLRQATGGDLSRSARYREFLVPNGFGDELRAAFRLGEHTWGALHLTRARHRGPFSPREVALVVGMGASVARDLAEIARTEATVSTGPGDDGAGTALFDVSGTLQSIDEQAMRWFAELAGPQWLTADPVRGMTSALVARAFAGRGHGRFIARIRTLTGRWLVLSASLMSSLDGAGGLTAVVIGPAPAREVAPILFAAYALTMREQEVCHAVARGLSNAEIAAEMVLSAHTVRDHLKAVFSKLDVGSRGELVAKLYAEDYAPRQSMGDTSMLTYW